MRYAVERNLREGPGCPRMLGYECTSTGELLRVFEQGMHWTRETMSTHLGQGRTRCNAFRAQNKSPNSVSRIVRLL